MLGLMAEAGSGTVDVPANPALRRVVSAADKEVAAGTGGLGFAEPAPQGP